MFRYSWIRSWSFDLLWIIGPHLISTLIVLFVYFLSPGIMTVGHINWLVLVVGIDVSHVYSTVFKTYLNQNVVVKNKGFLILVPTLSFLVSVFLYSLSSIVFWRILAYLAAFHFIRQQYGFLKIYQRKDLNELEQKYSFLDEIIIYSGMIYPLLYWHNHLPTNFNWFIKGDFLPIVPGWLLSLAGGLYLLVIATYLLKELFLLKCGLKLNLAKNLLILSTMISWYVGIVLISNDFSFTVTNIISHGIPYLAFVWHQMNNKFQKEKYYSPFFNFSLERIFQKRFIPVYFLMLFAAGFFEESLWDSLIWRDNGHYFDFFYFLPQVSSRDLLVWLVPLLALPQITHYILDGFIWKSSGQRLFKD